MTGIDDLLRNGGGHAEPSPTAGRDGRPVKGVAVVACMDARLDVSSLLRLSEGDAHVIRNAGGVITDDVIRSLMISQRLLGTTEIMLIHHTQCGMTNFVEKELKDEVEAETGVRPRFPLETFGDVDDNVRRSMERVRSSPFLLSKIVRGFVYDVDEGTLREVA